MISFAAPDREHAEHRAEIESAVLGVLGSGRSILAAEVAAFEQELANFVGARFAVGVSSGTDALAVAMHALGVAEGDEVVLGAFGFVAGAGAVVRLGARPVFVDVEPDHLGLHADAVRGAVNARTSAVLSTDLFGVAHDLSAVRAAAPGVPIVEDAAQALGAAVSVRAAPGEARGAGAAPGTARGAGTVGDAGIFSFFPSKVLGAAGDAGCVVTDDADTAARARRARVHGADAAYEWNDRGGNYRLDEIQAAILRVKLRHLPARLDRRRAVGRHLADVATRLGARPVLGTAGCAPVFCPLAVRVDSGRRDRAIACLRARGVDARVHYPHALAAAPAYRAFAQGRAFPNAERATRELLSVPCHPELSDGEVQQIEAALIDALG